MCPSVHRKRSLNTKRVPPRGIWRAQQFVALAAAICSAVAALVTAVVVVVDLMIHAVHLLWPQCNFMPAAPKEESGDGNDDGDGDTLRPSVYVGLDVILRQVKMCATRSIRFFSVPATRDVYVFNSSNNSNNKSRVQQLQQARAQHQRQLLFFLAFFRLNVKTRC